MKLEIKTDKKGICEQFKINDKEVGKGVTNYTIFHTAGSKPTILITGVVDKLIIDDEDSIIYTNKENIFKRIFNKVFKK